MAEKLDGRLVSAPGYVLPPHLRGIGFVFQSAALWPHMTVAGNILFGLADLPARADRLREALGRELLRDASTLQDYMPISVDLQTIAEGNRLEGTLQVGTWELTWTAR